MKQWFYFADDQQQGPVDVSVIRELIHTGKLTPESLVWSEGMINWAALKDVEELKASTEIPPPVPTAVSAPVSEAGKVSALADACAVATAVPVSFTVGEVFREGFALFKANWKRLLLGWFVYFAVTMAMNFIPFMGMLLAIVFGGALLIGFKTWLLRIHDGEPAEVGLLFSRFDKFWMAMVAQLLVGLCMVLGFLCLIIPGIYLCVVLAFWAFICADEGKGCDFIGSVKKSYRIAKGHFWKIVGVFLLSYGILILGLICLIVGVIPAMLITGSMFVVLYRKLSPKTR